MVAFKPTNNVKLRCNTCDLMDLLYVIHLTAQKGHFLSLTWKMYGALKCMHTWYSFDIWNVFQDIYPSKFRKIWVAIGAAIARICCSYNCPNFDVNCSLKS